ncbi:hypothetical protein GF312_18010 [Candidatus Poribacteria bacterium]|nr:hypothetical protein [Candidatus Poribacteria bacterium]
MNYRKLNKAMEKSGVEYDLSESNTAIQIKTQPDQNEIAQKNIEKALGKREACVNSSPGKFSVIETEIRVYKTSAEQRGELES